MDDCEELPLLTVNVLEAPFGIPFSRFPVTKGPLDWQILDDFGLPFGQKPNCLTTFVGDLEGWTGGNEISSRPVSFRDYSKFLDLIGPSEFMSRSFAKKSWEERFTLEPNLDAPITGLGLPHAMTFAFSIGCRLPTVFEWLACANNVLKNLKEPERWHGSLLESLGRDRTKHPLFDDSEFSPGPYGMFGSVNEFTITSSFGLGVPTEETDYAEMHVGGYNGTLDPRWLAFGEPFHWIGPVAGSTEEAGWAGSSREGFRLIHETVISGGEYQCWSKPSLEELQEVAEFWDYRLE